MTNQIIPGPCAPGRCPPPTEIVCIKTEKVYDFCFQVERRNNVCFSLPESCLPEMCVPNDAHHKVWCKIKEVNCEEISREPLSSGGGFFNVTFLITVKVWFKICKHKWFRGDFEEDGDEKEYDGGDYEEMEGEWKEREGLKHKCCKFWRTFSFTKTVTLCSPEGTETQCEIPSYSCGPCVLTQDHKVCCTFILCILVQAKAEVKLLVPAYGFCVPAECVEVSPEFPECPPENLFPPQCLPPVAGTKNE